MLVAAQSLVPAAQTAAGRRQRASLGVPRALLRVQRRPAASVSAHGSNGNGVSQAAPPAAPGAAPPAAPIPGDHMRAGMGLPQGVECMVFDSFELESGVVLRSVPLAYSTYGSLNAARDNAVVVGHSLTSNSAVADWWQPMMGPGGAHALDPDRDYVICCNYLGSPYGSASPVTRDPAKQGGASYGADFPAVTLRDNVRLQRQLLSRLGVTRVACAVGGSMGGMLALQWASSYPEFVDSLVIIAACGRHPDWAIGTSEGQRLAIYADPKWRGGRYPADDPPIAGLAAARSAAMLSYRAPGSVDERFCRAVMSGDDAAGDTGGGGGTAANVARGDVGNGATPARWAGSPTLYAVSSYLRHQGTKFVSRFDANCYLQLTHTCDSHDITGARAGARAGGDPDQEREDRYTAALAALPQRALVVGIDSDVLYPLDLQRRLAAGIPRAELYVISSPHGHDAFLIEIDRLNAAVARFRAGLPAHDGAGDDVIDAEASPEARAAAAVAALAEARAGAERDAAELKRLRSKLGEMERRAALARQESVHQTLAEGASLASLEGFSPEGEGDHGLGEGLAPPLSPPPVANLKWSAAKVVYGRREADHLTSWGANSF